MPPPTTPEPACHPSCRFRHLTLLSDGLVTAAWFAAVGYWLWADDLGFSIRPDSVADSAFQRSVIAGRILHAATVLGTVAFAFAGTRAILSAWSGRSATRAAQRRYLAVLIGANVLAALAIAMPLAVAGAGPNGLAHALFENSSADPAACERPLTGADLPLPPCSD